jgi:hypothetical protein
MAKEDKDLKDNNTNTNNKEKEDVVKYIQLGDETYNIGDVVSMKAPPGEKPYIAKILSFAIAHSNSDRKHNEDKNKTTNDNNKNNNQQQQIIKHNEPDQIKVFCSWYYRPEEAASGRKAFHGEHEVFASDHVDWVKASTIERKIHVYTLAEYQELSAVTERSFFSRFSYKAATSEFKPDHVQVFCKCSMPYNPDLFMVECDECKEWYHPECIGREREDLDTDDNEDWFCDDCQQKKHKKARIS